MFSALKQLGQFLASSAGGPTESAGAALVQLDAGQLVSVPAGESANQNSAKARLLLANSTLTIVKTSTPFQYQLVATCPDSKSSDGDLDSLESEEFVYLINDQMRFQKSLVSQTALLKWRDLDGQCFKFQVDANRVGKHLLDFFETVMFECMFELKFQKSHEYASISDLEMFRCDDKENNVQAVVDIPAVSKSPSKKPMPKVHSEKAAIVEPVSSASQAGNVVPEGDVIGTVTGDLHVYNTSTFEFVLLADGKDVKAQILDCGGFSFWFVAVNPKTQLPIVSQPLDNSMNPFFSENHLSFIWNFRDETSADLAVVSWSLKFADIKLLHDFRDVFGKCMYEALNKEFFKKVKTEDQKYLQDVYADVHMTDVDDDALSDDDQEESDAGDDTEINSGKANLRATAIAETSDEESQDEQDENKNSLLAVGYKHQRSFVVRGNKIGVFSHDYDDVKHSATINAVRTPTGTLFSPAKVMLHNQDSSMVLMNPDTPGKLYRMDLETAKVVDEWNVDEDRRIVDFTPDAKYAQMTPTQTFVGMSHNALFRIDPRQSGRKLVDSQLNQYKSKNEFRCAATTGKGELVVGSDKGDLRLYNQLDKRAKTHLPGMGDPIVGVDVTEDGKWLLATCKTYLLLMPTDSDASSGEKVNGFQKSLGSAKPTPVRLQLKPEHVAWINEPITFTAAKFNTGEDTERRIVTSTGSYVITWNLRRVKAGHRYDYTIKKYPDRIVADNFRYGSDKKVIVTLPDDVTMVNKNDLTTPQKLMRFKNSVVDSPY